MTPRCSHPGRLALSLFLGAFLGAPLRAAEPKQPGALDEKAFARPELTLSTSQVPLEKVMTALPNRAAWEALVGSPTAARTSRDEPRIQVHIDPRSGAATNIMGAFPLVPGRGVGNRVSLASLGANLGSEVTRLDRRTVGEAFRRFVQSHRAALNIDDLQLGEVRATQVSPEVWQISVPQEYKGVPVRHARLAGSVNNGNLVVVGTEVWGDVRNLDVTPSLGAEQALEAGFTYVEGRNTSDEIEREPTLEIVPVAPPEQQSGEAFVGPVGSGYGHRLVWTFVFRRPPDESRWEVMVDAHSGEVIAFQDINRYGEVKGGVYPLTSTEVCPDPERCGTLQPQSPLPYANTGLPAPNNFTSSAGTYDSAAGNATTTLSGRFVRVVDNCGAINVGSGSPTVDLGGTNGQHDCTSAGSSPGNTSSSRSSFYELNRIAEMARGWLPANTWLQSQLTANVNITQTCNAFYRTTDGTVNFFRSGGGCRNTGEIAAIFDHEWGHAMDDNDSGGVLSNSSEAYADIAAIYRLNASCVGYGFWWTSNKGCGQTADGTGFNANEAQVGAAHCNLDCSGVRDADWDKHADHQPDTALGFVCNQCLSDVGPCGRQVHCAAAPARQAAWDLVARDLQAAPFNLDAQTALIIGNRLFYQGSGNIGLWHSCTCGVSANGCGATNGYMQWLTADDDNGNLADGTPHMTAIFNAFNRHGIACTTPTPQNSGCAGGPTEAPSLTVTAGIGENQLSWTTVAGATKYWVFRTEGHAGCDFGKTRIAEVTGTSYADTEVAIGRQYSYNVMAAGSSDSCFSPASACASATPTAGPEFTITCSPSSLTFPVGGGSRTSSCTVASVAGFTGEVVLDCTSLPEGATCSYAPASVTLPADGSATSELTLTTTVTTPPGTHASKARGVSGAMTRTFGLTLAVPVPDFTLSCPSSLTVAAGSSGTASCTVNSANGFAAPVDLSCASLPAGVTCSYSPNPVTPPGDGTVGSTLTVAVSPTAVAGTFTVQARGVSGGLTRNFSFTLQISDFILSCSPTSFTIPPGGGSRTSSCTVTSQRSFAGEVTFDCATLPTGASCAYAPASVTLPANGSATSVLTLTTTAATPVGTYGILARGVSGSLVRSRTLTLTVPAPDFSLSCPSSLTVAAGSSGTASCTVNSANGFVAPVDLSCTNLPAGVTCSYSPNPVTPPGNGSVGSTLTGAVSPTAVGGSFSVQARGVSGALIRTSSFTLQVSDFILTCTPSSLTIPLGGGSRTSTCTATSQRSFAGEVTFDCASLPTGASCAYSPASVTIPANGSATSVLTLTTTAATPAGTFAFTARGVSGSLVRNRTMTLSVPAPDFALACSPSGVPAPPGGTGSGVCSVSSLNGFASPVDLSCSGLPAGVTCDYIPNPLVLPAGGSASSTLLVNVPATTPPGAYTFQAIAVAGALTRTFSLTLRVGEFTLTCSPSLAMPAGVSNTSTCTLQTIGSFVSSVSLSCIGMPPGVTCSPAPNPVIPPATTTLTLSAGAGVPPGNYPFEVRGVGGAVTKTTVMTLQVRGVSAAFDPALRVPKCGTVSDLCDSSTLLLGRDGKGPEPNQPNTIGASCADGTSGTFHVDESNDRITLSTLDGGKFAPGKTVKVEARAWVFSATSNKLDLYHAADATSPAWTYLTTLTPTAAGAQALSTTFVLPTGALQAVRARFRFGGTVSPCTGSSSSYDDHDDLVFAVNRTPVAQAGGPYSGRPHKPVFFDGSASSDGDGDPLVTYAWDFGDGTTGEGPTPMHIYTSVGSYTVTLVVSDGIDNSAPATTTANVTNQVPVAQPGGPYSGRPHKPVFFDGSASSDGDGDPLVTYAWDFGDGTTGEGPTPMHNYTSVGNYTVTLVVSDGIDNSTPATTTVNVTNQVPVANAGGPYSSPRNLAIIFDGSASSDPDGDPLVTYAWDFGDGTTGTGPNPTHAYTSLGSFTVTLVVSDGIDNSAPATATASIANLPPVANAGGPYNSVRNQSITFDGSASSDPDGDALTYNWDFGDGTSGAGPTPSHAYTNLGSFTVTLVVNDGTDISSPATTTVTINNLPPVVDLVSPGNGGLFHAPADVPLQAMAADPDGSVAKVEFFQGPVKIGEGVAPSYTFLWAGVPPGAYVLTARATDETEAVTTSAPVTILVNARPVVDLTEPVSGSVHAAPATLTLTAAASDADGTVAQVEFFSGSTSLGIVATSPYTLTLSDLPAGQYSLTARATDERGAVTTSAAVTITVEAHLRPVADAYVRDGSSNASRNFGSATSLYVKAGSTGVNRWTYLKFDTSGLASVGSARLRLYGRLSSTTLATVVTSAVPSASTSWGEGQITWNNRPGTGTTALASVTMDNSASHWYEWDVTAYLQQEKAAGRHVVTLVLKNAASSSPYDTFVSKESTSANKPELVLVP